MTPDLAHWGHLHSALPDATRAETFEELAAAAGFRVERIVSRGQASAPGVWMKQATAEWVLVAAGRARLELESPARILELGPGDWVHLPAGCRHRVAWTDPGSDTVWLAVHERG